MNAETASIVKNTLEYQRLFKVRHLFSLSDFPLSVAVKLKPKLSL